MSEIKRALLVEGSTVARALLIGVVEQCFTQPVEISSVRTPQEALLQHWSVDLALVDLDLEPLPALRVLGRLPPSAWRIATTLYDDEDRLLPALRGGIHGYLLKQDPRVRLVESLQRTVTGRPHLTPALARSLLHHVPPGLEDAQRLSRFLGVLGRGASLHEAAVELECRASDIDALIASIYGLMGRSAGR